MALVDRENDRLESSDKGLQSRLLHASSLLPPAVEDSITPPSRTAAARTEGFAYLDQGSKVSGKLHFDGPARIDGQVDGEINAKDNITIGESAVVTAQIKAVSIIVAGTVSGEISASQRIEIRPSAKVSGNLTAPRLVVHEGAVFDGHCAMQPDGARGDRKLTPLRREDRLVAQADDQIKA